MIPFDTLSIIKYLVSFILLFLIVNLLVILGAKSRKILANLLLIILLSIIYYFVNKYNLIIVKYTYLIFFVASLIISSLNIAQELRDIALKQRSKYNLSLSETKDSKDEIVDAVLELSRTKTGAIITIESHNTLDQFSKKAIELNADIRKELLLNIFITNTPLHDGAVIIRGSKILCAGAYFILTDHHDELSKTTGSRHRAAKGISEITDSFTLVVSEETGSISIAFCGKLMKVNTRDDILNYLDIFFKN